MRILKAAGETGRRSTFSFTYNPDSSPELLATTPYPVAQLRRWHLNLYSETSAPHAHPLKPDNLLLFASRRAP